MAQLLKEMSTKKEIPSKDYNSIEEFIDIIISSGVLHPFTHTHHLNCKNELAKWTDFPNKYLGGRA